MNLTDANLRGANLFGANLESVRGREAHLAFFYRKLGFFGRHFRIDTDLTGADLTGADLTGADLTGAKWSEDVPAPKEWVRDATSGRLKRPNPAAESEAV